MCRTTTVSHLKGIIISDVEEHKPSGRSLPAHIQELQACVPVPGCGVDREFLFDKVIVVLRAAVTIRAMDVDSP